MKSAVDFRSLYEDSLELTNHIDNHGIPVLQRDLEQLVESSRRLAEQSGVKGGQVDGTESRDSLMKASFLLAGRGFDAEKLSRDLRTLELKASYEPQEPLGETDIDGYLRHHHEMIIVTAIDEARVRTARQAERKTAKFLLEEWEQAKSKFLGSLGQRHGEWEPARREQMLALPPAGPVAGALPFSSPSFSRYGGGASTGASTPYRSAQRSVTTPGTTLGGASIGRDYFPGAGGESTRTPQSSRRSGRGDPSSTGDQMALETDVRAPARSQMSSHMQQYAAVVRALNDERRPHARAQYDVAGHFLNAAAERTSPGAVDSRDVEVLKCWQLLRCIFQDGLRGSKSDSPLREGEFAEDYKNQSLFLQRRFLRGSMVFLEKQWRDYMDRRVRAAKLQLGGVPGLLPVVQGWLRLRFDLKRLPQYLVQSPFMDNLPLWPQVYFLVRCGDCKAAADLLQAAVDRGLTGVEPEIVRSLRMVHSAVDAQMRGETARFSSEELRNIDRVSNLFVELSADDDASFGPSQRRPGETDPYKRTVCNLLSFADVNWSEPELATTIEDFMWQKLWFARALFESRPRSISSGSSGGGAGGGSQGGRTYSVKALAETVLRFGASHFDRDGKSPMVYFSVLLLCQQFERAVEYLASRALQIEAVHFAVALHHYGAFLVLPPRRRANASRQYSDSFRYGAAGGEDGSGSGFGLKGIDNSGLIFAGDDEEDSDAFVFRPYFAFVRLLEQYVHKFSRSDPGEAVEYLVLIRNEAERAMCLKDLILDLREFLPLVGTTTPDGGRQSGYLDRRLPFESVYKIVREAAREAEYNGRFLDAVDLYLAIGEIIEVVTIMNSQLAQVVSNDGASRNFWKGRCFSFADAYLSKSFARGELQRHQAVGNTFQQLLNLTVFFDHFLAGQNREAVEFMDSLHLLPVSDDAGELAAKEENFEALDASIKRIFHEILLAYMSGLGDMYERAKRERISRDDSRLRNLRLKARTLVTFAGLLKYRFPDDANSRLTRMEVLMI